MLRSISKQSIKSVESVLITVVDLKQVTRIRTRYDTRCYFNVRSKADISQLNLPHGKNFFAGIGHGQPKIEFLFKSVHCLLQCQVHQLSAHKPWCILMRHNWSKLSETFLSLVYATAYKM